VSCGINPHVTLSAGQCSIVTPELAELEVVDNCSAIGISYYISNNAAESYEAGVHDIVFTVTDADGNTSSCTQTLAVDVSAETCNGLDDNCNGLIDEELPLSCAAPNQVSVANITQTSAKVTWASGNCAIGYRIMYKKSNVSAWQYFLTPATEYTLQNLQAASTYQ
jgi:hypothetical protein